MGFKTIWCSCLFAIACLYGHNSFAADFGNDTCKKNFFIPVLPLKVEFQYDHLNSVRSLHDLYSQDDAFVQQTGGDPVVRLGRILNTLRLTYLIEYLLSPGTEKESIRSLPQKRRVALADMQIVNAMIRLKLTTAMDAFLRMEELLKGLKTIESTLEELSKQQRSFAQTKGQKRSTKTYISSTDKIVAALTTQMKSLQHSVLLLLQGYITTELLTALNNDARSKIFKYRGCDLSTVKLSDSDPIIGPETLKAFEIKKEHIDALPR